MPEGKLAFTLNFGKIENAPIKEGVERRGFLLWPGEDGDWTSGYWTGEDWSDNTDILISPIIWALLPIAKSVLDLFD